MNKLIFPLRTQRAHQRGAVAVELAIVATVMLLIVAGAIGFGRAYWYADALTKATRDGARLLSTWEIKETGEGTLSGVADAQSIVMSTANAANLSPQLTANNVVVKCAYSAFTFLDCSDTKGRPVNIRVSITGFSLNLSEWFPFVGGQAFGSVGLSPATTMRYMN